MEHAADVAWLDSGVRGKGWAVEERREQEAVDVAVDKKRASGPIPPTVRCSPATASTRPALHTSTTNSTPSSRTAAHLSNQHSIARPSSAALQSVVASVEPIEFLSLIKSDPTRAFQLIFPDYDICDGELRTDTSVHGRGRREVEEKEEAAVVDAQAVSAAPLSPYSAGWKYQHTAAFDVQRPDTAGERKQRTDEMKQQIGHEWMASQNHQHSEEDDEDEADVEAESHSG